MRVDKIMIACDDHPEYRQWWPLVSTLLHVQTGIEPTLLYVGDTPFATPNPGGFEVVSEKYQVIGSKLIRATCSRIWWASQLPDTNVLFWDSDLIPLFANELVTTDIDGLQRVLCWPDRNPWILAPGFMFNSDDLRNKLGNPRSWAEFCNQWIPQYKALPCDYKKQTNFFGLDEMIINQVALNTPAKTKELVPYQHLVYAHTNITPADAAAGSVKAWHPHWGSRGYKRNLNNIRKLLTDFGYTDLLDLAV